MNRVIIDQAVSDGAVMTYSEDHTLYGVNPPETLFNYTYWSHMVPPYKPESVLILGYGVGTVAKLIRKIWGDDVKITGVDVKAYDVGILDQNTFLVKFDALKYVEMCALGDIKNRFDYVVVDVWDGHDVPEWIFHKVFPKMLAQIVTGRLCLNVPRDRAELLDMYQQFGFLYERNDIIDNNCVMFFKKVNKDNE